MQQDDRIVHLYEAYRLSSPTFRCLYGFVARPGQVIRPMFGEQYDARTRLRYYRTTHLETARKHLHPTHLSWRFIND